MLGKADARAIDEPLKVRGHEYTATCLSVGNPHCVLFLDAQRGTPLDGKGLYDIAIEVLGPQIEKHAAFPRRVNVEFATLVGRDELAVRVWERGARRRPDGERSPASGRAAVPFPAGPAQAAKSLQAA